VPIIKALREGLSANRIESVAGIINGTTNFILSEMRDKGLDFATVLKQAQELGYAEADPTFDIEGVDAAHKLTIMAAIAFGIPMQFGSAHIEGISQLQAIDIRYAEELGYRIKLLGITRRTVVDGVEGIELRVHPTLIPTTPDRQRRRRDERGAGAGRRGRHLAVLRQGRRRRADRLGRDRRPGRRDPPGHRRPVLARAAPGLPADRDWPTCRSADGRHPHQLLPARDVQDQLGVMADLTRILADAGISIDAVLQKEPGENARTDIVIITHQTREKNVDAAIES
jgi:homoserine dehydrogenase